MAFNIQLAASLGFTTPAGTNMAPAPIRDLLATASSGLSVWQQQSIPTTAGGTAIDLGGCTAPGWAFFINRDANNYLDILSAVSGTVMARLLPGEFALFRLSTGAQAPAAIAHTASCVLEYCIINT
jgi:hypothetical protein